MTVACELCNKSFKYKYLYERHKQNKKPCKLVNNQINNGDLQFSAKNISKLKNKVKYLTKKIKQLDNKPGIICNYCNKKFKNIYNKSIHISKRCNSRKSIILEIDKINKYIDTFKDIKNILVKDKQIVNNNFNINNINNNNLILNVQINSFGKEDLSHITDKEYLTCIAKRYPGLFEFIRLVHLNKNVPQNHNFIITNPRTKKAYVFRDGLYETENTDDVIDDLINNNMWRLEDKVDRLEEGDNIEDKLITEHKEFKKTYYENNITRIQNVRNTVQDIILDNRYIILDTYSKAQNQKKLLNKLT